MLEVKGVKLVTVFVPQVELRGFWVFFFLRFLVFTEILSLFILSPLNQKQSPTLGLPTNVLSSSRAELTKSGRPLPGWCLQSGHSLAPSICQRLPGRLARGCPKSRKLDGVDPFRRQEHF